MALRWALLWWLASSLWLGTVTVRASVDDNCLECAATMRTWCRSSSAAVTNSEGTCLPEDDASSCATNLQVLSWSECPVAKAGEHADCAACLMDQTASQYAWCQLATGEDDWQGACVPRNSASDACGSATVITQLQQCPGAITSQEFSSCIPCVGRSKVWCRTQETTTSNTDGVCVESEEHCNNDKLKVVDSENFCPDAQAGLSTNCLHCTASTEGGTGKVWCKPTATPDAPSNTRGACVKQPTNCPDALSVASSENCPISRYRDHTDCDSCLGDLQGAAVWCQGDSSWTTGSGASAAGPGWCVRGPDDCFAASAVVSDANKCPSKRSDPSTFTTCSACTQEQLFWCKSEKSMPQYWDDGDGLCLDQASSAMCSSGALLVQSGQECPAALNLVDNCHQCLERATSGTDVKLAWCRDWNNDAGSSSSLNSCRIDSECPSSQGVESYTVVADCDLTQPKTPPAPAPTPTPTPTPQSEDEDKGNRILGMSVAVFSVVIVASVIILGLVIGLIVYFNRMSRAQVNQAHPSNLALSYTSLDDSEL